MHNHGINEFLENELLGRTFFQVGHPAIGQIQPDLMEGIPRPCLLTFH
jgi:hypothetical protein